MPDERDEPEPKGLKPLHLLSTSCHKCGGKEFREAHRIDDGKVASVMYECVKCGEYRL